MSEREPSRLCEDSSTADDVRKMIECAREDGPDETHMASLLARLPEIEDAAAASVNPAPASPASRIVPLMTVALLLGGGLWFMQGRDKTQPTSANQPVSAPLHAPVNRAERPETPSFPVPVEPVAVTTKALVHRSPPALPRAKAAAHSPGDSVASGTGPERSRPTEIALLAAAREALQAEDWPRAIRTTRLHERHYPEGVLGEEREAIAIEAMWMEGSRLQAAVRLREMTEDYPRSSYRKRLESLVMEAPVTAPPVTEP